ncbi:DUF885 domain-containing protein [endosymbiont GvMRE of Glomus versiforme]|uniref:DUF885 domain-containing protein n=1 Tax=endosymbiont GvMRE of Glomus versiforme TaxID=2039283 RepID=UPI000EEA80D6|nr:DUF885 domain-containing protein [endosymbiont GvMRE of Glomus versiforme]RHZ35566.1 DUF885 domain-containing protein [endosymbiont GvMRE of Glomus versiforme]
MKIYSSSLKNFAVECQLISKNVQNKSVSSRLKELFDLTWKEDLQDFPEFATYLGTTDHDHRWTDLSEAKLQEYHQKNQIKLQTLKSIPYNELDASEQLNYDLFQQQLDNEIKSHFFHSEYLILDQMSGVQQDIARILLIMPQRTEKDWENRLQRLISLPLLIDQTISLLQKGLEKKITPPQITLRDVPSQVKEHTVKDLERNPLFASFKQLPINFSEKFQERIFTQAKTLLWKKVIPAYEKLHNFLTQTYLPNCRTEIAWKSLPQGQEWYQFLVEKMTTTSLTASEIHQIGLTEVKNIQEKTDELLKSTGFPGTCQKYFQKLHQEPQYFYTKREEIIQGYQELSRKIEPNLPLLFEKIPQLGYNIESVPEYSEKSNPAAYYIPGAISTQRPGIFFANTYQPEKRPKWEMKAVFLHEAIPGHHFQISLAQEIENIPEFRKHIDYTAYVEGWGLYAEKLGYELGVYQKDVESQFGQLFTELLRAVRLVIDTGIHELGKSRNWAIQYFSDNCHMEKHEIIVEVDRYIVLPAQALAYKIGERKILELRKVAEKQLGKSFNIRKFHQLVLGSGVLPLNVLEKRVQEWIANH